MLKLEEAKPGVEVICIDASYPSGYNPSNIKLLKVGHIYTIQKCFPNPFSYGAHKGHSHLLHLNEIQIVDHQGQYFYGLHRFKTLKKKDIQIFYDILNQPIDQKIREEA